MFLKVDSYVINDEFALKIGKKRLNGWAASCQPLLFQLFVRFRENRPTKDYSCKISDRNSNSKCHLITDYEMVALKTPPFYIHLSDMYIKSKKNYFLQIFILCKNVLVTFCTILALKKILYLIFTFRMIDFMPIIVFTSRKNIFWV